MLSGIAAAEAAAAALAEGRSSDTLAAYERELREGPVGRDLKPVRNVAPLNGWLGPLGGLTLGGFDMWFQSICRFSLFGTRKHGKTDAQATGKASDHPQITYPKPDGVLSFDRLTNVSFSATAHDEEQPSHLQLGDAAIPIDTNLPIYDEPAQRYCPAGVYEVLRDQDGSNPRFQVNGQNCVHCKTCDIKDPSHVGRAARHRL